jgi:hypothetical protein
MCPVAVTLRVVPLIVKSPVTSTLPSSARAMSVEAKVISGVRSASKKSGDMRWPYRFSSLTTTLDTGTRPVMRGAPSS